MTGRGQMEMTDMAFQRHFSTQVCVCVCVCVVEVLLSAVAHTRLDSLLKYTLLNSFVALLLHCIKNEVFIELGSVCVSVHVSFAVKIIFIK